MSTPVETVQEPNLKLELERAYRCIQGMHHSMRVKEEFPAGYHALTIAAAKRYVFEGALDGSDYFIGKHNSVLQDALNLPSKLKEKNYGN